MTTYIDLIELVRICLHQAERTSSAAVRDELSRMAQDYQSRADALMSDVVVAEGAG
jgi:hypothetical protein